MIIFQMIKLRFREVEQFVQLTQLLGKRVMKANQISECFPLNPGANIMLITVCMQKD